MGLSVAAMITWKSRADALATAMVTPLVRLRCSLAVILKSAAIVPLVVKKVSPFSFLFYLFSIYTHLHVKVTVCDMCVNLGVGV